MLIHARIVRATTRRLNVSRGPGRGRRGSRVAVDGLPPSEPRAKVKARCQVVATAARRNDGRGGEDQQAGDGLMRAVRADQPRRGHGGNARAAVSVTASPYAEVAEPSVVPAGSAPVATSQRSTTTTF